MNIELELIKKKCISIQGRITLYKHMPQATILNSFQFSSIANICDRISFPEFWKLLIESSQNHMA